MNILDRDELGNVPVMRDMIAAAGKIAIVTHMNPDGDALGSSTGMLGFIESIGKEAEIFISDRYADTLDFIFTEKDRGHLHVFEEEPEGCEAYLASSDLIICLDFNSFSRTGLMEGHLLASKARKILVDHHVNPQRECFDLCFSKTDISSASELLYYLLMAMPEISGDASKLQGNTGRALMTGMTTDSNNFANSTWPSTLNMASELLDAGVDRDEIVSHINNEYRENRMRLMGHMLDKEMKIMPDGTAYMILDRKTMEEFNIREGETEGFVNLPLAIKEVRLSIFLKEDNGKFRFSARSKKGISARLLAERYFNGGGHELAAGGKLLFETARTKEAAAAYIEKVTAEFMKE